MRLLTAFVGLCLMLTGPLAESTSAQSCAPDVTKPVISGMPADISQTADAGICETTVTWTIPSASDNCELTSFTSNHAPGSVFAVGTTTVTYTAIDAAGNLKASSFFITITDDEDPTIADMPSNINDSADQGSCSTTATWTEPTSDDNCGVGSLNSSHDSGDSFPVGTTTVTYTSTDVNGNTHLESFDVIITDDEDPIISQTPQNITQGLDQGSCSATVTWSSASASDNCQVQSMGSDYNSGDPFTGGETTVTYTAVDLAGNSTTSSFTITISDTEDPSISNLPADINLNAAAGTCGADASWAEPTAADNCAGASIAQTAGAASGTNFAVGSHTITYTATDAAGNTHVESFTITVSDDQDPSITGLSADLTPTAAAGTCGADVSWNEPTANDNCAGASIAQTAGAASGTNFAVGAHTIAYTATDASGNTHVESFTITVSDNEDPSIAGLSANLTPFAAPETCGANVSWNEPTANDNCAGASIAQTAGAASGTNFAVGSHTITYTATDAAGNTHVESFTITVSDDQDPSITGLSADLTPFAAPETCGADVSWNEPTVNDNCAGASIAQTAGAASGTNFAVGAHTITYTATDAAGNTHMESFTITVSDDQDPSIAGLSANLTPSAAAGTCGADVSWNEPTVNDNCAGSSIAQTAGAASGTNFEVGAHTITYTATDAAGNTDVESFTITVSDSEDPSILDLPADITESCGGGISWTAPTASDNCSAQLTQTAGGEPGSDFPLGTTTVTYRAEDPSGNFVIASFTVTIADQIDPSIAGTPTNISKSSDAGLCSAVVTWTEPTSSDNCPDETLTSSHSSGDALPVGTTTVTYTATDGAGNSVTSSFDVTVTDDEDPSIAGTPLDITQTNDAGNCSAVVTWTAPTGSDNCSQTLTSTHNSGDTFALGTTTVTYTSTDGAGNSVTSSFDVTVTDGEDPAIAGTPLDITQTNDAGNCSAVVTWTAPTSSDNCPGETLTSTHNSGDTFAVGTTTVTYTATDGASNSVTSSFDVTVTDAEDPSINNLPANISLSATAGTCGADASWTEPTAADNCTGASIAQTAGAASGTNFAVGSHTITYTATDAAGNTHQESFTITISDDEDPTIAGLSDNLLPSAAQGTCGADVSWNEPTANDNCAGASIAQTAGDPSGSNFAVGSHTITYTATDAAGNTHDESFNITVSDEENPSIAGEDWDFISDNLGGNLGGFAAAGTCGADVSWDEPTANDNCAGASIAQTAGDPSGSNFAVGSHTITYTATDAAGNAIEESITIIIVDNEDPSIDGLSANLTPSAAAGTCGANVSWNEPTANDNCAGASIAQTAGDPSGSNFAVGSHTIAYTATDAAGNTHDESFTITVSDDEDPSIDGLSANLTPSAAAGTCGADVSWDEPTANDNCAGASIAQTAGAASGTNFAVGSHTITYTATDAAGNTHDESFTITVSDEENPTIDGLSANLTPSTAAETCGADVSWDEPTANDNCAGASIAQTAGDPSGSTFAVGSHTITYTATDAAGNTHQESFTIIVSDAENPAIAGTPSDITQTNDAGNCSAIVTWTAPTSSDNCPGETLTSSHNSGDAFALGTTTVTYTATDAANNFITSSFDVTVTDAENPSISNLPADIVVTPNQGDCESFVSWTEPTADDNCSASIGQVSSFNTLPIIANGSGRTVTMTSVSINGNASTIAQVAPGSSVNLILSGNVQNNGTACNGCITQAYARIDGILNVCLASAVGNSTFTKDVTFAAPSAPGIYYLNKKFTYLTSCESSTEASTEFKTSTFAVLVVGDVSSNGESFEIGTHTITYQAIDAAGNSVTDSFTITVNDNDYDGDNVGDCSDPDIDGDGALNENDSDDFDKFVCSDSDSDTCEDCMSGTYDPSDDGPDSDSDGICDDSDLCSDPLANNYQAPLTGGANEECQVCPDAPIFDAVNLLSNATTLSSNDGAFSLDLSSGAATVVMLYGQNGASDYTIALPGGLDTIAPGYYSVMVMDDDGCFGVAGTSVGGTTLQQPGVARSLVIPFDLCCSGCGIYDLDADGICDEDDNCTDQTATNYADPANEDCIISGCESPSMDGHSYGVVEIGDQCWFAENLRTTVYADGAAIPEVTDNAAWAGLSTEARCDYDNDASNVATYGRLYNWYAATDDSELCPTGWHVPTDGEWTALETYLGANGHSGTEGTALKSTSGWNSGGNGTDDFGFSALPGGYRNAWGGFFNAGAGAGGYWWSSSPSGGGAWHRFLTGSNPDITRDVSNRRVGFSVRCLRDAD